MSTTIRLSNFKHVSENIHDIAIGTKDKRDTLLSFRVKYVRFVIKAHNPLIRAKFVYLNDINETKRILNYSKKYGCSYINHNNPQCNRLIEIVPNDILYTHAKYQPALLYELRRRSKNYIDSDKKSGRFNKNDLVKKRLLIYRKTLKV